MSTHSGVPKYCTSRDARHKPDLHSCLPSFRTRFRTLRRVCRAAYDEHDARATAVARNTRVGLSNIERWNATDVKGNAGKTKHVAHNPLRGFHIYVPMYILHGSHNVLYTHASVTCVRTVYVPYAHTIAAIASRDFIIIIIHACVQPYRYTSDLYARTPRRRGRDRVTRNYLLLIIIVLLFKTNISR